MAKKQQKKGVLASKPTESTPTDWSRWAVWLPVLAAFLVFATGLGNDMTGVDDHASTVENPAVRNFSLSTLFSNFNLGMYAPLTWLGYAIAYGMGKSDPMWYHLLSFVVHLINTYLVYQVLTKLNVRRALVLPIALLFAIHPIQVESVAWIAGFSTPLYSLFSLLAFSYYLDYAAGTENRYRAYGLSLAMFVLACLAKSAAVTVPLTLVVLDWWRRPTNLERTRQWLGYAPFFLLALAFGLLTIHTREVSGTAVGAISNGYSAFERVLLVCYAPLFYIGKMLLPLKLNIYYSFDKINGQLPWQYFASPIVVAALALAAWYWREKAPYLRLGLLFFLSNIVIALPFATLGTFELCADHYNYLACIGIFFTLAEGLSALQRRFPSASLGLRAVGLIWVIAMAFLCFKQIRIWRDTLTVISNAINNGFSHKGMMHLGRGVEYGDLGKPQEAIQDFTRALELNPDIQDAYKMRGSLYAQSGQIDKAIADLEKYLRFDSLDAVSWNNLAMIHMQYGRLPQALDAFTRTIAIKPDAAISYQNRSKIYEMMGDTARMRADLQKAREVAMAKKGK
jgi:tetratricopeptide (TPR) repeat protein